MINHFVISIFNLTGDTPDGVYNPLTAPLVCPDVLTPLSRLRGSTRESAWDFAAWSTKLVDASTYGRALVEHDQRLTFDLNRLTSDRWNSAQLLMSVSGLPPATIAYVIEGDDQLSKTVRRVDLLQETVAAILVGYVRKLTLANGG